MSDDFDFNDLNFDDLMKTKELDQRDSDDIVDEAEKKGDLQKIKTRNKITKFKNTHIEKIKNLEEMFFLPKSGEESRLITQGSFNMFTIMMYLYKEIGIIDEMYLTTFNMKEVVISTIFEMLEEKKIKKLRIMISESINHRMPKRIEQLKKSVEKNKIEHDVKLKLNWNHSKIMLVRIGNIFYVLEGSGNLSDNAQIEQYLITNSEEIYKFHKKWMDETFLSNKLKREELYG